MRYSCTKCRSVFEPGVLKLLDESYKCVMCETVMERIPYYETPEQYEKRTGQSWPEEGPVWWRTPNRPGYIHGFLLGDLPKERKDVGITVFIICAQGPYPPPDGWKPEE
jgi:hypothetical protein